MPFSKAHYFIHKVFEAGLLAKAVEKAMGEKPQRIEIWLNEHLPNGGDVSQNLTSPSDLAAVCDIAGHHLYVSIQTSSGTSRSFHMREDDELIRVEARADTADDMQATLALLTKELDLKEASDEILATKRGPSQKEVLERLTLLERIVLGPNRTLRCFLSYRFTSENEDPARKLKDYLTLLGIDVLTGTTYEPRPISQKIMDRLQDGLDFIIVLIGHDGESFWTRDEIATAKHKGIPLVPIIEEGVDFASGLFGDLECVTYSKGHIGDCFLKVLEAVKYVREIRKPFIPPLVERE
jgi:hypothetical protein